MGILPHHESVLKSLLFFLPMDQGDGGSGPFLFSLYDMSKYRREHFFYLRFVFVKISDTVNRIYYFRNAH